MNIYNMHTPDSTGGQTIDKLVIAKINIDLATKVVSGDLNLGHVANGQFVFLGRTSFSLANNEGGNQDWDTYIKDFDQGSDDFDVALEKAVALYLDAKQIIDL